MDLYKELNDLKEHLKEYRELLRQLYPSPPLSGKYQSMLNPFTAFEGEKERKRDELRATLDNKREILIEKASRLSAKITQIVGKNSLVIHEFGEPRTVDVWDMGLRIEYDYRTTQALDACIDYTLQAIGKLEDEGTSWGIDFENQNVSKTGGRSVSEGLWQSAWKWIDSHRIITIITTLAAIATIIYIIYFFMSSN